MARCPFQHMMNQRTIAPTMPRVIARVSTGRIALHIVAGAIALLMLLPLAYLAVRAGSAGVAPAFDILVSDRTRRVVLNSLILVALVTIASWLIGIPFAWLTVRTDLPGRKWWAVLGALPLVIPSYVGAYSLVAMMGPRGFVQSWLEPFGVERLPSIYGLPGAVWALTLFTYPYLFLSVRAGLQNLDPAIDEAARSLGYGPADLPASDAAKLAPLNRRRFAACGALRPQRFWGRVDPSLQQLHAPSTCST